MALIKCKECEKEISDKAKTCPNCGCPLMVPVSTVQSHKCLECGEKIFKLESEKQKCPKCESSQIVLEEIFEEKRKGQIKCLECGKWVLEKNKKCSNCKVDLTETKEAIKKKETQRIIGIIVFWFIILFIISFAMASCSSSSNRSEETIGACVNDSTTYTKCSWSPIEDRCVCKLR